MSVKRADAGPHVLIGLLPDSTQPPCP